MINKLESLLNDLAEIKNTLNDIRSLLANTEAKPMPKKRFKTAINDSLSLNAPNKTDNSPQYDNLFDFSKIEYSDGSSITFSDFYDACCLDKSIPRNHFSKYFKKTSFYMNNESVTTGRKGKNKIIKNIRLVVDTSNQQS